MPAEATNLEFRGLDDAECEAFIRAVTAHALAEGKQHDDQWIAEFASSCFSQAGLRWWASLDEKDQGSWKLLRKAMLSRFQPTFSGGSGEEAEAFVRMIRQKAFEAGNYLNDRWMMGFASTCLAGEAIRWHASLDSATQNDWKLFWPALIAQYPRDVSNDLLRPSAKRRGRVQVRRKKEEMPIFYLSKRLCADPAQPGRVILTQAAVQALEVEFDPFVTKSQTLHIPDNQMPGCDTLAIQWRNEDTTQSDNWMAICGVNSSSGIGSPGKDYAGPLSTNTWKVSLTDDGRPRKQLFAVNGSVHLFTRSDATWQNHIWFRPRPKEGEFDLELFIEQV